jgi:protein phosphatase
VSGDTLRDTLVGEADVDVAVDRLVDLALKGGGPDNITAIVADVVEVETKPPSAVPVTVGAAAEGVVQRTPDDTPAGKAAALRPPPEEPDDEEDGGELAPGPGRARRIVLLLLLLVLLGGAAFGAYRWSQTQYYVGADGANVAIFRGLSQDIGPLRTSSLYQEEDVALDDLPPYQRARVRAAIATSGLADAERIVATLREQAEICREQAAAEASASAAPTPTPSGTGKPGDRSGSQTPATTPSPEPSPTSGPAGAADCGSRP